MTATYREMHVSIPFPLCEILKYIFILTCQLLESFLYICAFAYVIGMYIIYIAHICFCMCFNFVCPFLSSSPSSLNALPYAWMLTACFPTYYTILEKLNRASESTHPCVCEELSVRTFIKMLVILK